MTDAIIVGAGAAGLTAAYYLQQQAGWTVQILEANAAQIGGRLRKDDTTFTDLPIDLGGEWIHGNPQVLLKEILLNTTSNNQDLSTNIKTVAFDVDSLSVWDGEEFYTETLDVNDHKWVNSTWWDFFNDHIASHMQDAIVLGCQVTEIDYAADVASMVSCSNGDTYEAWYVVVTTSIQVLQDEQISFVPELPQQYLTALENFQMEPALKVFIEFQETFFPAVFEVESDWSTFSLQETSSDYAERVFYDETYGQTTSHHIMCMFVYGRAADQYLQAEDEETLMDSILQELDVMFDGKASSLYMQHVVQIWPREPYIRTGYTRWVLDDPDPIRVWQTPIEQKLFFAGEALPPDGENWGYAHGAAYSGKEAARKILQIEETGTYDSAAWSSCLSQWWVVTLVGSFVYLVSFG